MSRDVTARTARAAIAFAVVGAAAAVVLQLALGSAGAGGSDAARFLGRAHPLAVHLPIGALLSIAVLECLSCASRLRARLDPAIGVMLALLVGSAVVTFAIGLLLAHGGGYPARLLTSHRRWALATVLGTSACLVAWTAHVVRGSTGTRRAYRAALAVTVGLLGVGAHAGGSITHGEDYLVRYAPAALRRWLGANRAPDPPPPPPATGGEPTVFASVVLPVLRARCVECHGPSQAKAGLRLDDLAAMVKGGDAGPAIVPGDPDASLLVARMARPTSDGDRMPPDGAPGATPEELDLIVWWIARGAPETLRIRDALSPPHARALLEAAARGPTDAPRAPAPPAARTEPPAPAIATSSPGAGRAPARVEGSAWRDLVAPVLAAKCGRCHGAEKAKGGLRVDSIEGLLAGGKHGAAVVPGHSRRGSLLARVHEPSDGSGHMPPSGEPQLEDSEIELLDSWIAQGAAAAATASLPSRLRHVAPAPGRGRATAPAETESTPHSASPAIEAPPRADRLYADVVAPLFARSCAGCHGGESPDAARVARERAGVPAGDRFGAGSPEASRLLQRLLLPPSDPRRMPPDGGHRPSPAEIEAVRLWIESGAEMPPPVDAPPRAEDRAREADPSSRGTRTGGVAAASTVDRRVLAARGSGCATCTVGAMSADGAASGRALLAAIPALAALVARRRARRAPLSARTRAARTRAARRP